MSTKLPVADPHDPRNTARVQLYVPAGQGRSVWAASDVDTVKATASRTECGYPSVATRRVQHHHRTRVDQAIHRERDLAAC